MLRTGNSCVVLLFFLANAAVLFAQGSRVDTSITIEPLTVTARPLRSDRLTTARQNWPAEALRRSGSANLAELLAAESGVYIKSYGLGSLATLAVRGGAAGHTAVLWNGLPLSSPMLGLLDLSLLPLPFFDGASLEYGGQSASWGSGAIAGALLLDNQRPDTTGWRSAVRLTAGSFGRFDQEATLRYGGARWQARTRLLRRRAENDFPFRLGPDRPEQRQQNNRLAQAGLLQELYHQPNDRETWSAWLWWQRTDRQIPPTSVQTRSEASQQDESLRLALQWERRSSQQHWQVRAGHFRERILFQDPQILLRAPSDFATTTFEGEVQQQSHRWLWRSGVSSQYVTAAAPNYEALAQQWRLAAFSTLRYRHHDWRAEFSLREELVDGDLLAPVPALQLAWEPATWLTLEASLSRNYRLPTLNDRYWNPGGNPDLRPERGWSQELGLVTTAGNASRRWTSRTTLFNRRIRDWILWTLRPGETFFSPNNLTEVISQGLEQRLGYERRWAAVSLSASGGYDYVRSTNQVAVANPRIAAGEQLVYVPRHRAFAGLELSGHRWLLRYQHRYTAAARGLNVTRIPGYALGDGVVQYSWAFGAFELSGWLRIDNLWNTDYRVIERRPMPGRTFTLGVHLDFAAPHESANH